MVRRIQRRIQMSPSSSATTAPSLLATFALPKLLERTGAGDHLRIWVACLRTQIDTVPAYVARLKEECRTGIRLNCPLYSLKRILVANEPPLCTLSAMERRETTANEHWTVKAVFAFVLTCLMGAEIALSSGLPVLPSNWP